MVFPFPQRGKGKNINSIGRKVFFSLYIEINQKKNADWWTKKYLNEKALKWVVSREDLRPKILFKT